MYLYNVTYKIDHEIEENWLQWMRSTHIPKVVRVGDFLGHRICKLLGLEEEDGVTYAIQYLVPDMDNYHRFQQRYGEALDTAHAQQFKNRYVSFSTILEIIE